MIHPIPIALFDVGGQELIVIFFAILLFLGPKKLPELARALGKAKSEFNKASREFQDEIERAAQLPDSHSSSDAPKLQAPEATIPNGSSPNEASDSQKKIT
jgi:sec-independent protein translocase protein TatA